MNHNIKESADQDRRKEMAPRNNYDPSGDSNENVEEADLQEMDAVNESLDELSSALDFFEQRTDNIIEQLRELLHSNREIRQELAAEKAIEGSGNTGPPVIVNQPK